MSKVVKPFFCSKTKKSYKIGQEYKGKRTDLGDFLEGAKPSKEEKKDEVKK